MEEFPREARRKDGHGSRCKPCNRAYTREWKETNRASVLEYHRTYNSQYRKINRDRLIEVNRAYYQANKGRLLARNRAYFASRTRFMQAIKLTIGCMDCGYVSDPARLHFDHRDGTVKEFNPSWGAGCSWARLIAELDKCDVRCAWCHAKRHLEAGDLITSVGA